MKKYIILAIVLQSAILFSQDHIKPIVFDNYTPKWQHLFVDSTRLSDSKYLGTTHLWNIGLKPIINDSIAYFLLGDKSEDYQGAFIEKIHLNTGNTIWSNRYGLFNSGKQEFPSYFYINDNDNLEILNFRNIMKKEEYFPFNWTKAQLSIRKYNSKSGEILNHIYNRDSLSSREIIKIFYLRYKILPIYDTGYLYVYQSFNSSFNYIRSYFDINSLLELKDTISRSKLGTGFSGQFTYLLNRDTIVTGRHMHNQTHLDSIKQENFDSSKYYLDFYSSSFDSLSTLDLSDYFPYNWSVEILQPENRYVKIMCKDSINIPFVRPYVAYLYFDTQGNLIEIIDFKNKYISARIRINRLPNQQGTIIVIDKSYKENKRIEISKTDGKGNIEVIKTLTFKDKRNFYIDDIKILDDNTLLIWYDITKVNEKRIIINSINGVIAVDSLGLVYNNKITTSTENKIKLYPNPVNNSLLLEFEDVISGKVKIFNMKGQIVKECVIENNKEIQVAINTLAIGTYIVKIIGKQGNIIYNDKFIKMN